MPILNKKKKSNSGTQKIAKMNRLKALARKEEKKNTTTSKSNHSNHFQSDSSDSSDSDSSDYEEYLIDLKPLPLVRQESGQVDIKPEKQPEPEKKVEKPKVEKPIKTEKKKLKSKRKKKIIINNYYYKKEDKTADTKEKPVDKPEVIKKEVTSAPIPRDSRADLVKKVREQYILSRARQNILNF